MAYECLRLFRQLFDKNNPKLHKPMITLAFIFFQAKDFEISLEYIE